MCATEKSIALVVLTLAFSALSLGAQTVPIYTDPPTSQGIAQPAGTGLGLSENNTILGSPDLFYLVLNDTTDGGGPTLVSHNLNCFGSGYSFGNNGTSAQSWSGCGVLSSTFFSSASGIDHLRSDSFTHAAQGDTALQYSYLTSFGGATAASDEGVTPLVIHSNQMGYMAANLSGTPTTGAIEISTSGLNCHGYCATFALGRNSFAQGGILFDESQGGSTASIDADSYQFDSVLNNEYYTLSSGSVAVSTAWGNVVIKDPDVDPAPCAYTSFATPGQWQDYKTATCKVTLGSGSPDFAMGANICLAGPFQEEAAITSAPASSGGVQYISFLTRYAWDSPSTAPLVMQGGVCGQSIVATSTLSSWPVAYALVGATSSTRLFFSNCLGGYCNGAGGSGAVLNPPSGSTIDLTFYPSAFIVSNSNGPSYGANLAANTVPFQAGDYVVGAPTSQFGQNGFNLYLGQSSPTYGSTGISIFDAGPYPLTSDIQVLNSAGITPTMMNIGGAFYETFHMDYRPANSGAILYNNGVSVGSPAPYTIYGDANDNGDAHAGAFGFDPTAGNFTFNSSGGLVVGGAGTINTVGTGSFNTVGINVPSANLSTITLPAGLGDNAYIGTYSTGAADSVILSVNRNPSTGGFTNPAKSYASVYAFAQEDSGTVDIVTSSLNGSLSPYYDFHFGSSGLFTSPADSTTTLMTGTTSNLAGTVTLASGSTMSPTITFSSGAFSSNPVCNFFPQNATPAVVASIGTIAPQVSTTVAYAMVSTAPAVDITLGWICIGVAP